MPSYIKLEIATNSKLGKRLIQEHQQRGMAYEPYLTELQDCYDAEKRRSCWCNRQPCVCNNG